MKKITVGVLASLLVGVFACVPAKTHAFDFLDIIDPLGIRDSFGDNNGSPIPFLPFPDFNNDPQSVSNYYTNSNNINSNINSNVNSNVNSPNATISDVQNNNGTAANTSQNTGNDGDNGGTHYSNLHASCSPSRTSISQGDSVTWNATVSGGQGPYDVRWSGTDRLVGGGTSMSKRYTDSGTKTASIRVTSNDDQSISVSCSNSVSVDYDDYDNNNNDDYNNDDNYDNYPLYVSCQANSSYISTGDRVTWTAYVSGGSGSYRYDWDGTDNLSGSSRTTSKTYTRSGSKRASVNVRSGSREVTRECSPYLTVREDSYNDNYNYNNNYYAPAPVINPAANAPVSCFANTTNVAAGEPVTWTVLVNSGNPNYYTYSWTGTDGLYGVGSSLRTTYLKSGTKSAQVVVRGPYGETATRACTNSVYVNSNYVAPAPAVSHASVSTGTLSASCVPDTTVAAPGETVVWTSDVSGGNGTYRYIWTGTDGLSGSKATQSKIYTKDGQKTAKLTISSGGKSTTISCDDYVDVGDENSRLSAASFFSFDKMPWGLISIIIIFVLLSTVAYLIFNRNKI